MPRFRQSRLAVGGAVQLFIEVARLLLVLLGVAVGYAAGRRYQPDGAANTPAVAGLVGALVGYVVGGVLGRLARRVTGVVRASVSSIPAYEILAAAVGAIVGALVGLTFGAALVLTLPRGIGLALAGLLVWATGWCGGAIALSRAEELFSAAGLSLRPLVRSTPYAPSDGYVVDSSAVMDPALLVMVRSGVLSADLLVPRFVLDELQALADASGSERGRRAQAGLESLELIRSRQLTRIHVLEDVMVEFTEVDAKLVALARRLQLRLLTTDARLASVAELQGVPCLNIRRMASDMAPPVVAGSELRLIVVRTGKSEDQGIGYLEDGSMVVIAGAGDLVGQECDVVVTNAVATPKGRLYFARAVGAAGTSSGQPGPDADQSLVHPQLSRAER